MSEEQENKVAEGVARVGVSDSAASDHKKHEDHEDDGGGAAAASSSSSSAPAAAAAGFPVLAFDDDANEPVVVESLCFNCYENGVTRLLPTMIPYFREVVLASFECEHCGYRNSELQLAGEIQEKGIRVKVTVTAMEDLSRQVIKSESAVITVPELEFEFPAGKSDLSTIEGYLTTAADNLEKQQPERREAHPEMAEQIEKVIVNLRARANLSEPFTFIIDDPAGNSFIQPLVSKDPKLTEVHYTRSQQQDIDIGLGTGEDNIASMTEKSTAGRVAVNAPLSAVESFVASTEKEVYSLPVQCVDCSAEGENRMYICDIPHFKEIVLMSFVCDKCGYRSNEVRPSGGMSAMARRTTVRVASRDDLDRLVLKSDTSSVSIPELDLEVVTGSFGSCFTTIEGLLDKLSDSLRRNNPFTCGDSSAHDEGGMTMATAFKQIIDRLESYKAARDLPFTLILDDALGNTYIERRPGADPYLVDEDYERTFEQNEEFGINDMKTENYDVIDPSAAPPPAPPAEAEEEEEEVVIPPEVQPNIDEEDGKGAPAA